MLVLAYKDATGHSVNDGALHLRFSDDDGATWTAEDTKLGGGAVSGFPMNPTVSAGEDAGEPSLVVAPNGDLLCHMWRVDYSVSMGGTWQSRSTDSGETWGTPVQVAFVDTTGDDLMMMTDDPVVVGSTIYQGTRLYTNASMVSAKVGIASSADNGVTWTYLGDITTTETQEVGLVYVGTDSFVAVIRDLANTVVYGATSDDLGVSWSALTDLSHPLRPSGRHRIYTRAELKGEANWWTDPVLLMTGFELRNPGNSVSRRNAVWVSQDSGISWSPPYYVDAESDDAGYGDLFYDAANDQYVVVSYQGTFAAANVKQYRLTITGI